MKRDPKELYKAIRGLHEAYKATKETYKASKAAITSSKDLIMYRWGCIKLLKALQKLTIYKALVVLIRLIRGL